MRNTLISSAITLGLAIHAVAQTPNSKLQFEVATIKASGPLNATAANITALAASLGFHGGPGTDQPELFTIGRISVRNLLLRAFEVKALQISGPAWLTDNPDSFDISAKVPAGATKEEADVMLQNLLVERFGLVFHREKTETAGYELVVGKNGPKLTESPDQNPPPAPTTLITAGDGPNRAAATRIENDKNGIPQLPAGRTGMLSGSAAGKQFMSARVQTMTDLATRLESLLAKPVADRTGLTAKYDFGLAFDGSDLPGGLRLPAALLARQGDASPATAAAAPEPAPSIFAAIQTLGLRLDQKKVPVDLIVIDKLEKTPTDN